MRIPAIRHTLAALILFCAAAIAPFSASAAGSYDNCTGFIDSVPATIGTQGTWCLRKNLSTAITSGNAITITTNNVTVDCNHFKLGGLAAGNSSRAWGIRALWRNNLVVRDCQIRGFVYGIVFSWGRGHLIENNRLDNNLSMGIRLNSDNSLVHGNAVYNTGGHPDEGYSVAGIFARADVIDNVVSGVFAGTTNHAWGIILYGPGTQARDNRVRGVITNGSGTANGIVAVGPDGHGMTIDGNHVTTVAGTTGYGIRSIDSQIACVNNTVANYSVPFVSCDAGMNNLVLP